MLSFVSHLLSDCDVTYFIYVFFFFQAEDGIRDWSVTGVQTCALPISLSRVISPPSSPRGWGGVIRAPRSEERRVGKEYRSRWSTDHEKKKKTETNVEWNIVIDIV